MALLNDTKVYKPCRDTTQKLHRDVPEALQQLNRDYGTSRLYDWNKQYYNKLVPHVIHCLHLDSMVYQKSTKLTAPCNP